MGVVEVAVLMTRVEQAVGAAVVVAVTVAMAQFCRDRLCCAEAEDHQRGYIRAPRRHRPLEMSIFEAHLYGPLPWHVICFRGSRRWCCCPNAG